MRPWRKKKKKGDYGKGVQFWQTPAEAGKFVNGYTDACPPTCTGTPTPASARRPRTSSSCRADRCPRAANYGKVVDRGRQLDALDGKRQPIYAFVELGWPGTNGLRSITGDEVAGAVMNSLIHEARGVIYFNHSFAGPCPTQHVLREPCAQGIADGRDGAEPAGSARSRPC